MGDFEGVTAENALLEAAFTDPNIAVRRRAIGAFRRVPRLLSEHAYPLPHEVPDLPMNRMRRQHREEHRRYARSGLSPPPPGSHYPPAPPLPDALWREDVAREGVY